MRCFGTYIYDKKGYFCERKWSCKHFAIKTKPKRVTPESKTKDCEFYLPILDTT
jgi:hypothetical protein